MNAEKSSSVSSPFFAFPERFMFAQLNGLRELMQGCSSSRIELILLFDRADARLDGRTEAEETEVGSEA